MPAVPSIEATTTQWHAASRDGTRIAVHTSGSGPPLVLVHGTTTDHTRWAPVLPAIAARHEVHAMDRRGRGGSGDTAPYAIAREFEDATAVVEAVARRRGGRVDVLGHSYGALCALGAALQAPSVRRLVLYEPPYVAGARPYPDDVLDRIGGHVASGHREDALLVFYREIVRMPEPALDRMRRTAVWEARVTAAHTIVRECRMEDPPFALESIAALEVPVTLLLGGDSPPLFREATALLAKAIPRARVVELPGQQHAAMDTAPELFLEAVAEALP